MSDRDGAVRPGSARARRARLAAEGAARYGAAVAPSLRDIRRWSRGEWLRWTLQLIVLIAGLALFSLGLVLSLQSNLGANSWTVFHDGISRRTPLTIGQASQIVGLVMIAVSWIGGIRPGLGTILNMYLVGLFMDIILEHNWIPLAGPYTLRLAMLLGSLVVLGLATGLYIKAGFGAGPRDSFNISVMEITGLSISVTRWMIESTVVIIGIFLGGRFGPGTIVSAFLIGPAVGIGFRVCGLKRGGTGSGATVAVEGADGQAAGGVPIIVEADSARD